MSDSLAQRYGGFTLAGMPLALPMAALREVVPLAQLLSLPTASSGVIGAIDLRGVLVPVLDLRRLLIEVDPGDAPPARCALVMVHEGHLLALAADEVTEVFAAAEVTRHDITTNPGAAPLLAASLRRQAGGPLISLLAPAALAGLPGVPRVRDPEPERARIDGGDETLSTERGDEALDGMLSLMLVRCGTDTLAIDALAVHATVADPQVLASPLAMGVCRGVIESLGRRVPAVDLLALLGLGQRDATISGQAFLVRHGDGLVAYLVDAVLDVLRVRSDALVRMPAFALARPDLVSASLPIGALPAEAAQRLLSDGAGPQMLAVRREHLVADPVLCALATAAGAPGVTSAASVDSAAERRPMLIYRVGGRDTATPLSQVSEILPLRADTVDCNRPGEQLGLVIERGRAVPLLCLSRLLGGHTPEPDALASVLVIEQEGDCIGFVVPALRSIEEAHWEPALPAHAGSAPGTAAAGHRLAQIGEGPERRLLQVVDLQALGARLRQRAAA